jgi:hypothetical protein
MGQGVRWRQTSSIKAAQAKRIRIIPCGFSPKASAGAASSRARKVQRNPMNKIATLTTKAKLQARLRRPALSTM